MPFGFGDLTDQAHHLVSTGDLAGAQRLLSDALSEADPRPANATADMAEAASLHARVLVALGEPHSARGWAAYAYAAQTRLHGRSDPRTVAAAATLAAVLHRVGSQSRAARLYQDVIVELTAQEGPESLRVLAAHADLATVEYARGQCRTARYRLRDTWDLHREVYGEGHPSGIKMLARLGAMQRDCGEFAEAQDNLALARELCRQHLPVDDPLAVQVAALARAAANPDHVCADEPPEAPVVPSARTPSYGEAPAYDRDEPEPDEPLAVPTPRQPADDPAGTDEAWWPDEPAGWSADPTRPGWQQPDDPPTGPIDEPGAAGQATWPPDEPDAAGQAATAWPPDEPDATGPAATAWPPDEPDVTGPAARPDEPRAAGPAAWPPDEPGRAGQATWPPDEPSGARPAAWPPDEPDAAGDAAWPPDEPGRAGQATWPPDEPSGARPPDEPGAAGQAAWHRNEPGAAGQAAWPPEERGAAGAAGWSPDEPGGARAVGWPPGRPGDEVPGGPLPPPGGSVPPAVVAMAGAEEADGVHRVRRGADPVEPYQPSRLLPVPVRGPSTPAGRRLVPIVVGGVVVVLLGAAAVIAGVAGVDGDDPPRATPSSAPGSATTGTPGPSGTPSPSRSAPTVAAATPGTPPSGVSLRDNRDNVTLRWTYPAGGEGPVVVSGGRAGQPKSALTDLPAGTNSFIIYGLNSSLDYCFTVAVVWSTDTIAAADEVCTRRR